MNVAHKIESHSNIEGSLRIRMPRFLPHGYVAHYTVEQPGSDDVKIDASIISNLGSEVLPLVPL